MSSMFVLGLVSLFLVEPASAQLLRRGSEAVRGEHGSAILAPSPTAASPARAAPPGAVIAPPAAPARPPPAPPPVAAPAAPRATPATPSPSPSAPRSAVGGYVPYPSYAPYAVERPYAPAAASPDLSAPAAAPRAVDYFATGGGVRVAGPIGLAALPASRSAAGAGGDPLEVGEPGWPEDDLAPHPAPPPRDEVRGEVRADLGYVLPTAGRLAARARIELPRAIDLQVGYAGYIEPNASGGFDALAVGRLGLGLRLVEEPGAQLRLGAAARHWHDWAGPVFGAEANGALDAVIDGPAVLSIDLAAGFIGAAVSLEARATIGVRFGGLDLFVGWDQLALLPFERGAQGVDLGGPVAGVCVTIGP